jgi:multiple sugar transport system ATP-binding protein
MVAITFDAISKNFGGNAVIREFSAEVNDGEFLVFLGPSGCGKSTMLRMVAGLTDISSGALRFDAKEVNNLSPKQRNIAFVFQSYALYPHMTVRENIAFPLLMDNFRWWHHIPIVGGLARRSLMKRADVSSRVTATAEMIELTDYLDRRPKVLSGGQRQRVAVARSIIRGPSIYLFDEPLSNLDAKLRMQMRAELSALHARVRKTFVYVTHDQVEAMTMGTKIIVMNDGAVQQYGTPREIYEAPANVFVARFIGSPPMNIFDAEVTSGGVAIDGVRVVNSENLALGLTAQGLTQISIGVRPEKITFGVVSSDQQPMEIGVHSVIVEHLGAETIVGVKVGAAVSGQPDVGAGASRRLNYVRMPGEHHFGVNDDLTIRFSFDSVHLFHPVTGDRIDGKLRS